MKKILLIAAFAAACLLQADLVIAKSLYVIANINANPTPIRTYDIQGTPSHLVFQSQTTVPGRAGGAVGLGIDTTNAKLFITYEGSNVIQLVDATNFTDLGTTTATSARNLAGIVIDQGNNKLYTVDRETNHLYVYSWNSASNTLTLDGGTFKSLTNVLKANGIALDETRARLYIGDRDSTTVHYYDTHSFGTNTIAVAGTVDLSAEGQTAMGIAVDSARNIIYTGNAYGPYGSRNKLVKYDLSTNTISAHTLPSSNDNIIGVAVDENTGHVYASTGNQGTGGTDTVIVFNSNLTILKNDLGNIGNPTGIAIPREDVSFNPLNFTKVDSLDPVATGNDLSYRLCYDNTLNPNAIDNVTIVDTLPAGVIFVSATGSSSFDGVNKVTWDEGTVSGGAAGGASQVCHDLVVNVSAATGSTLLNSATIDSDQTPPTTRTEITTVTGGSNNICDINNDGIIDRNDISAIFTARGTAVPIGTSDPRDIDGDGLITVNDGRQCVLECTFNRCAPVAP